MMKTNAHVLPVEIDSKCISNTLDLQERDESKMQNSSPDSDPVGGSALYNDSGYLTNINPDPQSFSSNSEPSFEASEEMSLHSKHDECIPTLHSTNSIYFCEDAVFDEPKLEGPPLLCDNTNNYEEFSSLIKFSLQADTESYLTNDVNLQSAIVNQQDISINYYDNKISETVSCASKDNSTILQYFEHDSLSSLSSINASQPICVSEVNNRQNILSQAAEQCLTVTNSHNETNLRYLNLKTFLKNETSKSSSNSQTFSSTSQSSISSNENIPENFRRINLRSSKVNTKTFSVNYSLEKCNNTRDVTSNETNQNSDRLVSCTPTKSYKNTVTSDLSPELFSDDDDPQSEMSFSIENISQTQKNMSQNEQLLRNERKLLKRVQETLSGVPPPPSVTILQISISDMLDKINNNKQLFLSTESVNKSVVNDNSLSESLCTNEDKRSRGSLLISSSKEDVEHTDWPEIQNYRYHGLHFNRGKVSEDFEHYCTKYAARYMGAETASSCTVWSMMAPTSATKRRNAKLRWGVKSPGRRLSHLARRRITFSSSNLQQAGANLSVIGNNSGSRQLMIDARKSAFNKRKSPRKSPWKKSPRKSPLKRIKTPSSSAKKRSVRRLNLGFEDEPKPGCSKMSNTKRALFQSPEHSRSTISTSDASSQFLQRNKSKRALFMSPTKKSPRKANLNCDNKKRKRTEEDCHPSKFPRSLSFDVHHSNALNAAAGGASLLRRNSEIIVRPISSKGELSNLHKQKMLWAVSEALRAHQIGMSHPQFRSFASILCKIIKHLVPDLLSNGPRQPGSTSDRMLRIARQHSYAVTRGKSVEEILQQIKETTASLKNSKPPTGYVGLDTVRNAAQKNILQDKVMNIESNSSSRSLTRSPVESKIDSKFDENSKYRSIRRQIVFDDAEITKSCNTNR